MTRPIQLFQGADQKITVEMNDDLTSATEIEVIIDTSTQIKKTLTASQITNVTAAQFEVQIDAADTTNMQPGTYRYQARATLAGKLNQIQFTPDKIRLRANTFITQTTSNDYE